jgi:AraC-like DNA-binding protein
MPPTAPLPTRIPTLDPPRFLSQFAPEPAALPPLLLPVAEQFFIVPVEQLYPCFPEAIPPVRATAHSLLLLTSGAARMRIGAEDYRIGAGQALLVRAGQVYAFGPDDVNTGLLCHFHDSFLLGPGAAPGSLPLLPAGEARLSPAPEAAGYAEALLRRLLTEYQQHGLQAPELLRAYLLALLQELARGPASAAPAPLSAAGRLTEQFRQLLPAGLPQGYRVRDYAARLHVTPDHLARCVRAVTGKAPARWLEEAVVREAQVLLFQSGLPVAEVALAVGLPDASYFSRLFRKHTGLSPLAFRKQRAAS